MLESQKYSYNPERKYISPEKAKGLLGSLKENGAGDLNWVIASINGAAGAGHDRQADFLYDTLLGGGLEKNTSFISLPFENVIFGKAYGYLQNTPWLYKRISGASDIPHFYSLIDKIKQGKTVWRDLLREINNSPRFDKDKKTIFITTHVDQEQAAIYLKKRGYVQCTGVIAYVPDPWKGGSLLSMTNDRSLNNGTHMVIVHDRATAQEYRRIRPRTNAIVLPLGTVSDPYFLLHESKKSEGLLHIGIEFSGNRLQSYDGLILCFIESIRDKLISGGIRLTVHTMHHRITYDRIKEVLDRLGVSTLNNIRVIFSDRFKDAVHSRKKYIRGTLDTEWPAPDIVISKGGEVPLEHRGDQLVIGVFGAGHEEADIRTGEKEGRALNYIDVQPKFWYDLMVNEYKRRNLINHHNPQSHAVFAPLLMLEPHALDGYLGEDVLRERS